MRSKCSNGTSLTVLVSDLAMPGEDGFSLIGKVRAAEAESGGEPLPAVALTAYVRIEDRTRALSAGFNMFVPKPVEPNELITAIAEPRRTGHGEFDSLRLGNVRSSLAGDGDGDSSSSAVTRK